MYCAIYSEYLPAQISQDKILGQNFQVVRQIRFYGSYDLTFQSENFAFLGDIL